MPRRCSQLDERVDRKREEQRDDDPDEDVPRDRTRWSTAQTPIASAKTARIVSTRKRMTRSATAGSISDPPDVPLRCARNPCPFAARSIEHELTLPDGRIAQVRVGMAHDGYIPEREEETVVLEVRIGRFVEATLNTVLDPAQDERRGRAREGGRRSTRVGPRRADGGALEQYADRLR